jgi:hypothetical protein
MLAALWYAVHGAAPDPWALWAWVPLTAAVAVVLAVLWHYDTAGARRFNAHVERSVRDAATRREIADLEAMHALPDAVEPVYGPAPVPGHYPQPRRALMRRLPALSRTTQLLRWRNK